MVKIDAVRIWARAGLLLVTTVNSFAAVPVENLTAEKVGIPPEDFISPETAKKLVAPLRDPLAGDYVVENAILFPWVTEDWNVYEPDIKNGFYEVTVYSGKPQYGSFDELNEKLEKYLAENPPLIYVRDGEWHVRPPDLLGREDITRELFGYSEVVSYYVPMNKKLGHFKAPAFAHAIGWNTLMLYVCDEVVRRLYPGCDPVYKKSIAFGYLPGEIFFVYRADGNKVFIQTSGEHNETRVFTNPYDFYKYYETTKVDRVIKIK